MKVVDRYYKYKSKSTVYHLIPLGDIHIGNVNADIKAFLNLVNWLHDCDNCIWLGMGDYIDIIPVGDKRHNIYEQARYYNYYGRKYNLSDPQEQYLLVRAILKKIKDKCIGILAGNHELKYENQGANFARLLADDLDTDYLDYASFINLHFQREGSKARTQYTIFAMHGFGGGRKTGSKVNRVEDLAQYFDADIYLMGHTHDLFVTREIRLYASRGKIRERKLIFANTGTFLRTYNMGNTSYGEMRAYKPTKIGVVRIDLIPEEKDLHGRE